MQSDHELFGYLSHTHGMTNFGFSCAPSLDSNDCRVKIADTHEMKIIFSKIFLINHSSVGSGSVLNVDLFHLFLVSA